MIADGICPTTAPKMLTFLNNKDKKNRCMIEMITVVHVGKHLKAGGTQLEGDGFEFITAYDTMAAMGEHLKSSMSSFELMSELLQVVEVNGGKDDASLYCGSRRDRVASVTEILLSLSSVRDVMVSINSEWWDWGDEVAPQPRYKGKIVKWQSKSAKKGAEVACFKVARIFNPLHVLGNQISVADIDSLKIFRLSEHPLIRTHIEGMKSELIKYHALVESIKPLDQRKDAKGKDTFVLSDWWRCNSGELPRICAVRCADKRTQLVPVCAAL